MALRMAAAKAHGKTQEDAAEVEPGVGAELVGGVPETLLKGDQGSVFICGYDPAQEASPCGCCRI
jgi:hypothetical protein